MIFQRQIARIYNYLPELPGKDAWLRLLGPDGKRRLRSKRALFFSGLLAAVLIVGLYFIVSGAGTVPKNIKEAVPFSVYYPKNLPPGYALDMKSFRLPEPGVVLFAVAYSEGKTIVFSETKQPSDADMDKFVSNYIPLNTELQLPLGQARVGAYGTAPTIRTAASLPIHNGPWLIVTAPSDVSHEDLVKILQALTK